MDIFSILFLICVSFGLYLAYLIVERIVFVHAVVSTNGKLKATKFYKTKMFLWVVCSTYNCWYLFVKGF